MVHLCNGYIPAPYLFEHGPFVQRIHRPPTSSSVVHLCNGYTGQFQSPVCSNNISGSSTSSSPPSLSRPFGVARFFGVIPRAPALGVCEAFGVSPSRTFLTFGDFRAAEEGLESAVPAAEMVISPDAADFGVS